MCRRVTCEKCGKPTYADCDTHIEAVLGDVPEEARCHCRQSHAVTPPREDATVRKHR